MGKKILLFTSLVLFVFGISTSLAAVPNRQNVHAESVTPEEAHKILEEYALVGIQIHEIQPVKFGGSPIDAANKIAIAPGVHAEATNWWYALLRSMNGANR